MKLIVNRHAAADGIHYSVDGINGAKWEAMASNNNGNKTVLNVENIASGNKYKLQHAKSIWNYI